MTLFPISEMTKEEIKDQSQQEHVKVNELGEYKITQTENKSLKDTMKRKVRPIKPQGRAHPNELIKKN